VGRVKNRRDAGVTDDAIRTAAVLAAAALLAAPYRQQIQAYASRALEAGKEKAGLVARIAAAALIVAAAWGKVPMPSLALPAAVQTVKVETPSDAMQMTVRPVAAAMAGMNAVDRAIWADAWSKAALVVAGDVAAKEVAFTDTRSLRLFTALALDIAWRRIGKHAPGENQELRKAVEAVYGSVMGEEEVPVTRDLRERYAEMAKAIAWAGIGKG
jgi:hypothetical protein